MSVAAAGEPVDSVDKTRLALAGEGLGWFDAPSSGSSEP